MADFVQHFFGIIGNLTIQRAIWNGLIAESKHRNAYQKSIELVDNYFSSMNSYPENYVVDRAIIANLILDGTNTFDDNESSTPSYEIYYLSKIVPNMQIAKSIMDSNGIKVSDDFNARLQKNSKHLNDLQNECR